MSPLAPPFGSPRSGKRGMVPRWPKVGTISDLAVTPGDGQAVLTWSGATGAFLYTPQYKLATDSEWISVEPGILPPLEQATILGLTNDAEYDFRVIAQDPFAVDTTTSNEESATPTSGAGAFGAVNDLAEDSKTDTTMTIDFTQVADDLGNPAKYAIRYRQGSISSGTWGEAFSTEVFINTDLAIGVTKSHQFTGLAAGTTYGVMLIPFRGTPGSADAFGDFSNAITVTTTGSAALGTISDLVAQAGDEQAALSWTPAENATSHQPQYKESASGTWLDFGSALGGSASSVTVTGLDNGTEYDFRVQAGDGATTTDSNEDSATPTDPGPEPWSDMLSGLTLRSTLTADGESVGDLSNGQTVGVDSDWQSYSQQGTDEVVNGSAPNGSSKLFRLNLPAGSGGNPNAGVLLHNMPNSRRGCVVLIFRVSDNWVHHPDRDKWIFWRKNQQTNQIVGCASSSGNVVDRAMNWPGGVPGGCHGGGAEEEESISINNVEGDWYALVWRQDKPASFPNNGDEELRMYRWGGSSWSLEDSFDITRTYCVEEDEWDQVLFSGIYGGLDAPTHPAQYYEIAEISIYTGG